MNYIQAANYNILNQLRKCLSHLAVHLCLLPLPSQFLRCWPSIWASMVSMVSQHGEHGLAWWASLWDACQVASYLNPSMLILSVSCASISIHTSNNHKYVCSILLFYLVAESKHGKPVCEACLVTTVPQFTLAYRPWVPACWPWLWVVAPLSSNKHKIVYTILLFHLDPESQNV